MGKRRSEREFHPPSEEKQVSEPQLESKKGSPVAAAGFGPRKCNVSTMQSHDLALECVHSHIPPWPSPILQKCYEEQMSYQVTPCSAAFIICLHTTDSSNSDVTPH